MRDLVITLNVPSNKDDDAIFWECRNVDSGDVRLFMDGRPTRNIDELIELIGDFPYSVREITVIGQSIFVTTEGVVKAVNGNFRIVEYRPVPDSIRQGLVEKERKRAQEDLIAWAALEHERLTGVSPKQLIDVPKEDE